MELTVPIDPEAPAGWVADRSGRRVLLFPRGNNVDHASMYLEQGHEDAEKAPEGWYACVQFTLLMWNKHDPSIYISHCKPLVRRI